MSAHAALVEQHTQGEWVWSGGQLLANRPREMCSVPILVVDRAEFMPSPADARLITAGPVMVEALKAAKRELWSVARPLWTLEDFKNWAVVQQIDAALTKATGEAR